MGRDWRLPRVIAATLSAEAVFICVDPCTVSDASVQAGRVIEKKVASAAQSVTRDIKVSTIV